MELIKFLIEFNKQISEMCDNDLKLVEEITAQVDPNGAPLYGMDKCLQAHVYQGRCEAYFNVQSLIKAALTAVSAAKDDTK